MKKEQIERIVKEYIGELPGVSQRDVDDKSERIAFWVMRLAQKEIVGYIYETRDADLIKCKKFTGIDQLPSYNQDPDATGPLVPVVCIQ